MSFRALATVAALFMITGCTSSSKKPHPAGGASAAGTAAVQSARSFRFEYAAKVTGIPADAKSVRIWVPLPSTDATQKISNLKVTSPVPHKETREDLYGNRLAYFEASGRQEIPITIAFDVKRPEVKEVKELNGPGVRARALQPDRLGPIDAEVIRRAEAAAGSKQDIPGKSRAIYDKVLADVNYDKSGQGWGRGDIKYVCEVGKGNCSDFHALFIGMARAQKIPALFEIGFPIPIGKSEGVIGGYHCWAWYQAENGAWRPVDASEADKDPSKTDYYYGTLCANRVALSRGRDLVLAPPQGGDPVNFLIYPHVEVDGKADVAKVEKKFSFKNNPPGT